jgi:AcrR family transcriptional regulator
MAPTETPTPTALPSAAMAGVRSQRSDARRNREAIVEAARGLFAEQGYDAQMDDIARAAGVGVGTVYRHFPTKEDLLQALMVRRFEKLTTRCTAAVAEAETGDAWKAFRDFILYSAEIQSNDRALSEAMAARSEKMSCCAEDSGLVAQLDLLVKKAKQAGVLRKDFQNEDVPAMVCSIGAVAIASFERPRMRWERVVRIWLDGVRADAATEPLPKIPG